MKPEVLYNKGLEVLSKFTREIRFKRAPSLLHHKDDTNCLNTVGTLGEIGSKRAIEPFVQAPEDRNSPIQDKTVSRLGEIGDERAIRPLIKKLRDTNVYFRKNIGGVLDNISDERADVFLRKFDLFMSRNADSVWMTRESLSQGAFLAWDLAEDDGGKFDINLQILEDATKELSPWLRGLSWKEHSQEGQEETVKKACQEFIQTAVKYVMGQRFSAKDASEFIRLFISNIKTKELPTKWKSEGKEWKYYSAESAGDIDHIGWNLCDIGLHPVEYERIILMEKTLLITISDLCLPPPAKTFRDLVFALEDTSVFVREAAADTLGNMGDKRAVEPLIRALASQDWRIQGRVAISLGKIGDRRALDPLIRALKSASAQAAVAEALGDIGDEKAVEPLIRVLRSYASPPIEEITEALGKIGGERATATLVQLLTYKYHHNRESAADTLGKLNWLPKDDVEKAYCLVAKRDWNELVRLGQAGNKSAIQALNWVSGISYYPLEAPTKDIDVETKAKEALRKISNVTGSG